jgi:DNA-binding transcriptional MocR family regulator
VPQWRVGFIAAAPALAEKLIDSKLVGNLTTPGPLEDAVALCLQQGTLRRHAERVVARLAAARTRTVRLLGDAGCRLVTPPAGLFGWVDVGFDTEPLAPARCSTPAGCSPPGLCSIPTPRPTTLMRVTSRRRKTPRF